MPCCGNQTKNQELFFFSTVICFLWEILAYQLIFSLFQIGIPSYSETFKIFFSLRFRSLPRLEDKHL